MKAPWPSPAPAGCPHPWCGGFARAPNTPLWLQQSTPRPLGRQCDRIQPCPLWCRSPGPYWPWPSPLLALSFSLEVLSRDLVAQIQAPPVRHPAQGGTGCPLVTRCGLSSGLGFVLTSMSLVHPSHRPGGQSSPGAPTPRLGISGSSTRVLWVLLCRKSPSRELGVPANYGRV